MKRTTFVSRIMTGVALTGCLSLLLADSAEPFCADSRSGFDRTFDYTTTCGGDHSGRFRFAVDSYGGAVGIGRPMNLDNATITLISGEMPPAKIQLMGGCAEEGDPTVDKGIFMSFGEQYAASTSSSSSSTSGGGAGGNGGNGGAGGNAGAGAGGAPASVAIPDAECWFYFTSLADNKPVDCFLTNDLDKKTPVCTLQLSDAK